MLKKRSLRLISILLGSIVLLFLVAQIILYNWNSRLRERLSGKVTEFSNGNYGLTMKDADLSIIARSLKLKQVVLAPVKTEGKKKATFLLSAKLFSLKEVSVFSLLKDRCLNAGRLELEDPQVTIYLEGKGFPETGTPAKSLYEFITPRLKELSIGNIELTNFRLTVYSSDSVLLFSSQENVLSIKNFLLNGSEEGKFFQAEQCKLELHHFTIPFGEGLYSLSGKHFRASYTDDEIQLDSLVLAPLADQKSFPEKAGRQISRVVFTLNRAVMKGADLRSFVEYQWLVGRSLEVTGCKMQVFRDDNYKLQDGKRPSVQQIAHDLPFYLKIDTLKARDIDVQYDEVPEGSVFPSQMRLNEMEITVTGTDNRPGAKEQHIKAFTKARFMNAADLELEYDFPLNTDEEMFSCRGRIFKMDLKKINPMTLKARGLEIKGGELDKVEFQFDANDSVSQGMMKMLYHDLEINIKDQKDGGKEKEMKTWLFMKYFIDGSNPSKDGRERVVRIYTKHESRRYFLFYTLASIGSGIGPSIMGEKKAKIAKRIY